MQKEYEIFTKIKQIIADQVQVVDNQIELHSVLGDDLGASHNYDWRNASYMNSIDDVEIVMAIEEEFDIEIPDEEIENLLSWNVG